MTTTFADVVFEAMVWIPYRRWRYQNILVVLRHIGNGDRDRCNPFSASCNYEVGCLWDVEDLNVDPLLQKS